MTGRVDVRSCYTDDWGDPDREAEFVKDDYVIGVLKWRASAATQGVNLYATAGASDYPVPGFNADHRQEFFVGFSPECDDIASPLARLAIYPQLTGKALGAGHIYRAPQGLMDGSSLRGFVLLAPLDGLPAPRDLADGRHVEFLMAVPVFEDELDFASANGVDGLLDAMESAAVPFWDPARRSTFEDGRKVH